MSLKITTKPIKGWLLEHHPNWWCIRGRTEDGYETLYTVMQPVRYHDHMFVYFSKTYRLRADYVDELKEPKDEVRGDRQD